MIVLLAAWATITWLGVYIIVWMDQAECAVPSGLCMRDAFKGWLYKLIQLSWVYHYQSLIAGILAVLGASALLINSKIERDAGAVEAAKNEEARISSLRVSLSVTCRRIMMDITTLANAEGTLQQITDLDLQLTAFGFHAPKLTSRIQYHLGVAKMRARAWMSSAGNPAEEVRQRAAISAHLYIVLTLLSDAERAKNDNSSSPIEIDRWGQDRMQWDKLSDADRSNLLPDLKFFA